MSTVIPAVPTDPDHDLVDKLMDVKLEDGIVDRDESGSQGVAGDKAEETSEEGFSMTVQKLPKAIWRRILALKRLQVESVKLEAQFHREVFQLECKYAKLHEPLREARAAIVGGLREPTDEECIFPPGSTQDEEEETEQQPEEAAKGVPNFWLNAFRNSVLLHNLITEEDELALEALLDVTATFSQENPMGFTLKFFFAPNDFFDNVVLTKEYFMKCEMAEDDPFVFQGPEIYGCKGCNIIWKPGKDLTAKIADNGREETESFFRFFSPLPIPQGEQEMDEETEDMLASDFELGHYIREKVIMRGVLFYTGEEMEDFEMYEDDEEWDSSEESDTETEAQAPERCSG